MAKSRVQLRIEEADLIEIDRRAASINLNRSDFIRQCALTDDRPSQLALTYENLAELKAWRGELKKVGNNLNQISRKLNRHQNNIDQTELDTTLEELRNVFAVFLDATQEEETIPTDIWGDPIK